MTLSDLEWLSEASRDLSKRVDGANWLCLVSKVPLNVACEAGDECLDVSAECVNHACQCLPDFFDRNGVCGIYIFVLLLRQL